jgi:exonuclease SbcC
MNPITVTIEGFGPYAARQTIDFQELGEASFFLIHGTTGSGKSTILDAICFALYGDTSGGERSAEQMRSQYAAPQTRTRVVFDFSLGREIYRVERLPKQRVPKKRGSGFTEQSSQATLWRRTECRAEDEEGDVVASGHGDVTKEIVAILGFESNQFRQVVVLPQGQFREFLTASSQERERILNVLFKTEKYARVEVLLKDAASQMSKQVEEQRKERDWRLKQAHVASVAELEALLVEQQHILAEQRRQEERLRQEEAQAEKRFADGKEIQRKLAERDAADEALQAVEDEQERINIDQEELTNAVHASALANDESILRDSQEALQQAQEAHQQAIAQYEEAVLALDDANAALEEEQQREEERAQAQKEVTRLEAMRERIAALESARAECEEAQHRYEQAQDEEQAAREHLESLTEQHKQHQEELDQQQQIAYQRASRHAHTNELDRALQAREQIEQYTQQYAKIEQQCEQTSLEIAAAKTRYQDARSAYERQQQAWIEGQAAVLARKLIAGQPCPVCGSREHPVPATAIDADLPTDETLEASRVAVEEREQALETARSELHRLESEKTSLEAKIQSYERDLGAHQETSLEALRRMHTEATQALDEAETAVQRVEVLKAEGEAEKHHLQAQEASAKEREQALQEAQRTLWSAKERLQERSQGIPAELQDEQALDTAIQRAIAYADSLEQALKQAQQAVSKAETDVARAEERRNSHQQAEMRAAEEADHAQTSFQEQLQAKGFVNEEQYQAAKRSKEDIFRLEERIQSFTQRLATAHDRRDRAHKEAEGLTPPDLTFLEEKRDAASEALEQAISENATSQNNVQVLTRWLKETQEIEEQIGDLDKQYTIVGTLAGIANGNNESKISFQRFVLATYLDRVLVTASERLRIMSNGRFQLKRAEESTDRRKAGGLDLEVYDVYTGQSRPTKTLSGGESFQASLALALGLADVVQSDAGGVHLETIFIDEGFGSLDEESIERAIKVLMGLQEGGRLVGIISHVAELQRRIQTRLEVTSSRTGSVATFNVPLAS